MEIKTNGFKMPNGDIHTFIPPSPTETERGGIKAKAKTTETIQVAVGTDGFAYVPDSPVDNTLTKTGQAADAKAVGDELNKKLDKNLGVVNAGKTLKVGDNGDIVAQDSSQFLPITDIVKFGHTIEDIFDDSPYAPLTHKKLTLKTTGTSPECFFETNLNWMESIYVYVETENPDGSVTERHVYTINSKDGGIVKIGKDMSEIGYGSYYLSSSNGYVLFDEISDLFEVFFSKNNIVNLNSLGHLTEEFVGRIDVGIIFNGKSFADWFEIPVAFNIINIVFATDYTSEPKPLKTFSITDHNIFMSYDSTTHKIFIHTNEFELNATYDIATDQITENTITYSNNPVNCPLFKYPVDINNKVFEINFDYFDCDMYGSFNLWEFGLESNEINFNKDCTISYKGQTIAVIPMKYKVDYELLHLPVTGRNIRKQLTLRYGETVLAIQYVKDPSVPNSGEILGIQTYDDDKYIKLNQGVENAGNVLMVDSKGNVVNSQIHIQKIEPISNIIKHGGELWDDPSSITIKIPKNFEDIVFYSLKNSICVTSAIDIHVDGIQLPFKYYNDDSLLRVQWTYDTIYVQLDSELCAVKISEVKPSKLLYTKTLASSDEKEKWNNKLDGNLGIANANKFLIIDSTGNIVPQTSLSSIVETTGISINTTANGYKEIVFDWDVNANVLSNISGKEFYVDDSDFNKKNQILIYVAEQQQKIFCGSITKKDGKIISFLNNANGSRGFYLKSDRGVIDLSSLMTTSNSFVTGDLNTSSRDIVVMNNYGCKVLFNDPGTDLYIELTPETINSDCYFTVDDYNYTQLTKIHFSFKYKGIDKDLGSIPYIKGSKIRHVYMPYPDPSVKGYGGAIIVGNIGIMFLYDDTTDTVQVANKSILSCLKYIANDYDYYLTVTEDISKTPHIYNVDIENKMSTSFSKTYDLYDCFCLESEPYEYVFKIGGKEVYSISSDYKNFITKNEITIKVDNDPVDTNLRTLYIIHGDTRLKYKVVNNPDGTSTVTPDKDNVYDGATRRIELKNTDTNVALDSNKLYVFPEMSTLTYTLNAPTNTNIVNEYRFIFQSGATATQIVHPVGVKIGDFKVEPNKAYEVSVMENLLVYKSWAVV